MANNIKNLEAALFTNRNKFQSETDIIQEVRAILNDNEESRQRIKSEIESANEVNANAFIFDHLETDKIFHLNQIRNVCIDYRLRFLDSHLFKDGIPDEAISKIHLLERTHDTTLGGYKIMAPTKAFRLLSYDDPLLFAPIGNDYYYLLHQWGNDISKWRKWLVMPFKNLWNFVVFCLFISIIITSFVPEDNLSKAVPMATIIVFLFMFKSIVAVLMYAFFMMGKNFNTAIWDRVYFNN